MAKNGKGFLVGTLAGTIVGGIAALIFAKKTGKEFRKDVTAAAGDVYDKAGSAFDFVGKRTKKNIQKIWLT